MTDENALPQAAVELLASSNSTEAWNNMVNTGFIDVIVLKTFGGVITPIIRDSDGQTAGYVTHWFHNLAISVVAVQESGPLKLIDTFDWNLLMGTYKALEIWELAHE